MKARPGVLEIPGPRPDVEAPTVCGTLLMAAISGARGVVRPDTILEEPSPRRNASALIVNGTPVRYPLIARSAPLGGKLASRYY